MRQRILRRKRRINFDPNVRYFKPQGIPMTELEEIVLHSDELEAIRLHDHMGLDQNQTAEKMDISQPTVTRILNSAYKKIADAITNGKAIRIE